MISNWIHQALIYVEQNPGYGYLFSFLISFLESLPIVGTIVPGSITMTAVGTLIGTDTLPLIPTFTSAIIGAFLGDFTGFLFGRLGEERIFNIWPFKKHRHWLEYGRAFFNKHGGKSVVIGRFIGPIRSAVPMVASLMGMSYSRFIVAGACSATLWSLLYIMPGFILGKYSKDVSHAEMAKWITLILIIIVVLTTLYVIYKASIYIYQKHYENKVDQFWGNLASKNKFFQFFSNPNLTWNATPLLLIGWICLLSIALISFIVIDPFCTLRLSHLYPNIIHYFKNHHLFEQIQFLAPFTPESIFLCLAVFATGTTALGCRKTIYSMINYGFILTLAYLAINHLNTDLFALTYQNLILWLPLAIITFSKATEYKSYTSSIYIIVGVVTFISNMALVLQRQLDIYTWILSWLIAAIIISIYCLFSFRLRNADKEALLDSIVVVLPYTFLLLIFISLF